MGTSDRSGRPHLVLVHGSRLSSTQWLPVVPLLEPHVGVTLVDLPGHGPRADETFTMARCVEVVDEAVDAVPDDEPAVVVGHSLGGYVGMAYGAAHGDRLAGLVLAGASTTPVGPGAALYRGVAAVTERIGPARMTRINDRVLRRVYGAEMIDPVIAGGYYFTPTAAAWSEVMTHCRPSMLAHLEAPVLLLNGQYDQFRLGYRAFVRAGRDVRVELVPRASHMAPLDQPGAFAAALLRFVEGLPTV